MLSECQQSAHRAQPPSRFKPRWQPYPYQSLGSTFSAHDVNTPKPSVPPSPAHNLPSNVSLQCPKDPLQREVGKQKYALGLTDQAVKTLSEIWHPEDIPGVFVGPSKGLFYPTPHPSMSLVSESDSSMLPIRNFIHEVLKRSRTSGSVMQTALCYLEAIRSKVPEILRDEKLGIRSYFMPESTILPATEAELQMDRNLSISEQSRSFDELSETVHSSDEEDVVLNLETRVGSHPTMNKPNAIPLPSPLLCPRRTFLASLILAAKFSQDKCYSNRAWAKISGLPPREIGRCERALGQALDWRLWVGKKSSISSIVTPVPTGTSRAVVRTQSESCISSYPSTREPFLRPSEPNCHTRPKLGVASGSTAQTGKGLRRCSTIPAETFSGSRLPSLDSAPLVKHNGLMHIPSDSGSDSSTASPETPPYSPRASDRTIQISAYEDNYSASPVELAVEPPDPKASIVGGDFSATQLHISLVGSVSDSLWNSLTSSHLWHADGGHLSLESAVH